MRIDAHQHFWLPERVHVEWMDALTGEPARRLVRPQRRQPALQQRQHLLGLGALVEEAGDAVLGAGAPHVLVIAVAQHDRARADAQLPDRPQHPQPAAGLQRQVHHTFPFNLLGGSYDQST